MKTTLTKSKPADISTGYIVKKMAKTTTLKFWALENPFGLLRRFLGHPVMIFNPYDFGDGYQKKTCLWGFFNIPKKKPVEYVKDYIHTIGMNGKPLKKYDQLLFQLNESQNVTKELHCIIQELQNKIIELEIKPAFSIRNFLFGDKKKKR